MKTWMKVVLGIVAGFTVLLGFVFWLTGDVTKAGDDFFAAAKNDDMDAAYALLSDDFQAGTSKEELNSYLAENALDNVKGTSWSSRSINGSIGELEGTVTTERGGTIPIRLGLVRSDSGWRIQRLDKANAGINGSDDASAETSNLQIPENEELIKLAKESNWQFISSLIRNDFGAFHRHFSDPFQAKVTLQETKEKFSRFNSDGLDLTQLRAMRPVFIEPPQLSKDGILNIVMVYDDERTIFFFEHEYIKQKSEWKLDYFAVKTKSSTDGVQEKGQSSL